MRSTLSNLLSPKQASSDALYLVQSSAAQSALPILRGIINAHTKHQVLLVCSLYASAHLLGRTSGASEASDREAKIIDWTQDVPGYNDIPVDWKLRLEEVQNAIKGSQSPVVAVIDSVDTIEEDLESPSETYKFLSSILSSITSRKDTSRLICHLSSVSPVLPLLRQPRFAASLIHISAHPPALLTHISRAYLCNPPSSSSSSSSAEALKFWRVFVPLSERPLEIEALVFGSDEHAEGGGDPDELVVEVLNRARGADVPVSPTILMTGSGKRKNAERILEGWSIAKSGPVPLEDLDSLKGLWRRKPIVVQDVLDPAKGLTFNLNLTDSQQMSRSQVPLPYEHTGNKLVEQSQNTHIFYDPDSADDLDDEDPDDDLDL